MRMALCATVLAALALAAPAQAQNSVKFGELRCNVSVGLGLIIASQRDILCHFTSTRGFEEDYHGTISKFGLDIGKIYGSVLAWEVFAPVEGPRQGALAGEYVGVTASAAVGAGLGANALIGGFNHAITLQPFSVESQTGLALSAGVAELTLR
jgi:hypothetical protein